MAQAQNVLTILFFTLQITVEANVWFWPINFASLCYNIAQTLFKTEFTLYDLP